jgi:alkanesulfonate monooxygenase SsuD/methylene tetrahydromethanopterin reductase-like flavin-dependent oxidoreductase (luciferase family)
MGEKVSEQLDRMITLRGAPESITSDNGSEFTGRAMDHWAHQAGVKLNLILGAAATRTKNIRYRDTGCRAGHSAEKLIVGLHFIDFLGDTTRQAADDFYPGYAHTFTEIEKERGWPPTTRAQFDAVRGPTGALLIGDAETVAEKILYLNEVLGGLSRITFQMGVSTLPHQKMLRSIEILGTRVAPIIRKELTASPTRS